MKIRIRDLRKDMDKTQQEIADLLCVSQRTYSGYEICKNRISIESLIKLAEYYDVNMDYITGISKIRRPFPKK